MTAESARTRPSWFLWTQRHNPSPRKLNRQRVKQEQQQPQQRQQYPHDQESYFERSQHQNSDSAFRQQQQSHHHHLYDRHSGAPNGHYSHHSNLGTLHKYEVGSAYTNYQDDDPYQQEYQDESGQYVGDNNRSVPPDGQLVRSKFSKVSKMTGVTRLGHSF